MSEQIKVVVIEDEMPAARLLSSMLKELRPEWNVQILSGSVEDSVEWFAVNPHPDLIFLDIQLSDGISFSFLERAKPASQIIFTTAYDEYAVRAFSVNSVDYLLKPVDRRRLLEAIERFEKKQGIDKSELAGGGFDRTSATFPQPFREKIPHSFSYRRGKPLLHVAGERCGLFRVEK